ncbi:MAG: sulfatase-like hydrolase/transferase, partial [Desulfovibrionales bacterium]
WHLDGSEYPGWVPTSRGRGFEDSLLMFNRGHWKYVRPQECGYPGLYADEHTFGEYFELDKDEYADAVYTTDYLADVTVDFIREHQEEPFLFTCSIPDPHQPWCVGPPYDTMFDPDELELPETFDEDDVATTFPFTAQRRERIKKVYSDMIAEHGEEYVFRRVKAAYLGMVKRIDDNVGRIVDALRETGQLENTIVVFTSDHGDYMGSHRLLYKGYMHRASESGGVNITPQYRSENRRPQARVVKNSVFKHSWLNQFPILKCRRAVQGSESNSISFLCG